MSYQVLARKYRPRNFSELKGQSALVQTLTNAISMKRVHHAYLLTGIRGVGKTTTARIIAKNLNCTGEDGNGSETTAPCEKCANCLSITSGSHPDVIEFDAASNTGIDDVKIIIDGCKYAPIQGRKKIFIVDEVHMLSTKAFNALLKTLEEPPANMIFIFATTEIRKVPITIVSRCQKFNLRSLDKPELIANINEVCKKEGYAIEEKAAELIAKKADGSVRDSLSILDQAIVNTICSDDATNNTITLDITQKMLMTAGFDDTIELFLLITNFKTAEAISKITEIIKSGIDEKSILSDLMDVTNLIIKSKSGIQIDDAKLAEHAKDLSMPFLIRLWQILIKGVDEMNYSNNLTVTLEMIAIKACYTASLPTATDIIERLKNNNLNDIINLFDGKMVG